MATKAATFKAKIRSLEDYVDRVTRSVTPLPTGADICNTLKYFSMTLLGVLKDVPVPPPDQRERAKRDADRLAAFPNLNYADFYTALHRTMEAVALVQQGQVTLGQAVLHNLGCLVPFLTHDLRESLPYTVASLLATFPNALLSEIIDLLCSNLLPVILGGADPNDVETYVSASVPAIIMMVFQYVSNPGFHSQVVECIMGLKRNVFKDLLIVIAHGTHAARLPAANLLFHYWPSLNPSLFDKRGIHYKYMVLQ